jgi:hypothetical protein
MSKVHARVQNFYLFEGMGKNSQHATARKPKHTTQEQRLARVVRYEQKGHVNAIAREARATTTKRVTRKGGTTPREPPEKPGLSSSRAWPGAACGSWLA